MSAAEGGDIARLLRDADRLGRADAPATGAVRHLRRSRLPVLDTHHRCAPTTAGLGPHTCSGAANSASNAAPSIEWDPADGMFGLIQRLGEWLRQAALGELDPDDQPLHPPVAYTSATHGVIVIRADLGERAPSTSTHASRQLIPPVGRKPKRPTPRSASWSV